MKNKPKDSRQQQFMMSTLESMLDSRQPLYKLAAAIPWEDFEEAFSGKYSAIGRPAKAVRLMVGLLILKQLEDLSDDAVVERWVQNPYYQYFCGEETFKWEFPCASSDITHFRNRIGEEGVEKILKCSIALHGKSAKEKEVVVDTTVQEKNITYPVDSKQYVKIVNRCNKIAKKECLEQRRSYVRTVPKLRLALRNRKHPNKAKQARKAQRQLKTIAGRLLRELERKLPEEKRLEYAEDFKLYWRVLSQKKKDKNKIYSLHEPQVCCYTKGKEHKKYEFGSKASFTITKNSGIIVGAKSYSNNIYDGHTLDSSLEQVERLTDIRPQVVIADQTFKGRRFVGTTEIITTGSSKKTLTVYQKRKRRSRLRRRAAIEPIISHAKYDFRLKRNFLKGEAGDSINLMMAAAAFNFRKWIRELYFLLAISRLQFKQKSYHRCSALISRVKVREKIKRTRGSHFSRTFTREIRAELLTPIIAF